MFSWRKGHVVTKMVDQYVGKAEECLTLWRQAFEEYLRNGFTAEFGNLVDQTHVAESECDDIRRNVEASLYERALIPESRGDIAFLLEAVDRIPSKADQIVHIVQLESLAMPPSLADRYSRLVELNCECFSCLAQAVRLLFTDMARVPQLALEIEPLHTPAMSDLAVLLMHQGRREEAVVLLHRVLELRPEDEIAARNLSRLENNEN